MVERGPVDVRSHVFANIRDRDASVVVAAGVVRSRGVEDESEGVEETTQGDEGE